MTTPNLTADAARASVTPHTVHLELARSQADGAFVPVLQLALSLDVATELVELLTRSVARSRELRAAMAAPAVLDGET